MRVENAVLHPIYSGTPLRGLVLENDDRVELWASGAYLGDGEIIDMSDPTRIKVLMNEGENQFEISAPFHRFNPTATGAFLLQLPEPDSAPG